MENIQLFLAQNEYSEVEEVAKKINKLVREENKKYKQISIITQNMDNYSSLVRAIFDQYNIPVFIDEKKDLGSNILVRYVLSLLEIFAKNWSYESVFGYIKTGLLDLDTQEIAVLENYCLKWGIKGSKWHAKEWNFYNETLKPLADKELIEQPFIPGDCIHNAHMYYIKLPNLESRSDVIHYLREHGVMSVFHYIPLHSAPAGKKYGRFFGEDRYTTKESERLVRLPMYYQLSQADKEYVVKIIFDYFNR